jgi:hypothetical protein
VLLLIDPAHAHSPFTSLGVDLDLMNWDWRYADALVSKLLPDHVARSQTRQDFDRMCADRLEGLSH